MHLREDRGRDALLARRALVPRRPRQRGRRVVGARQHLQLGQHELAVRRVGHGGEPVGEPGRLGHLARGEQQVDGIEDQLVTGRSGAEPGGLEEQVGGPSGPPGGDGGLGPVGQLGGQGQVGAGCRGRSVGQRLGFPDHRGGPTVQVGEARRAEGVEDRGPDDGMAEHQRPAVHVAHGVDQAAGQRLLPGNERVGDVRDRGRPGQRAAHPEHRGGRQQPAAGVGQAGEHVEHVHPERLRRR